jgi:hypothetical protein
MLMAFFIKKIENFKVKIRLGRLHLYRAKFICFFNGLFYQISKSYV